MKESAGRPQIALIEAAEGGTDGAVTLARIADPSRLFDGQSRRLHKDVVDVLVDLAISLLDEECRHEGAGS